MSARLRRLGKRAIVVRAEDLISRPFSVLSELQAFLHLRSALDEHYSVFDRTGEWNLSDTSDLYAREKSSATDPHTLGSLSPTSLLTKQIANMSDAWRP